MKDVKLTDKFTITKGRILISGTQALVKLPTLQKQLDEKNGLNTAGERVPADSYIVQANAVFAGQNQALPTLVEAPVESVS